MEFMAIKPFQFYLSTALIWMIVGGAFVGFNFRSYTIDRMDMQGIPKSINSKTDQVGWPFICLKNEWNNFFDPPAISFGNWRIRYHKELIESPLRWGPEYYWTEFTTTDVNLFFLAIDLGLFIGVVSILKRIVNSSLLRRKNIRAFERPERHS